MSRMSKNQKTGFWGLMIAVAMIFGVTGNAVAQSGSFYIGASAGAERADFEYAKTVDSSNVPNDYLQSGKVYHSSDSASKTGFGGGLLAGYRFNLDPSGTFYLSAEIDGRLHGGTTNGTLPGDGQSDGRNQYGENWPDEWSVERKNSYGVTLILGVSPTFLTSLLGPGAGVYALGGLRRMDAELKVDYNGCLNPRELCESDEFVSGTDSHDETFYGWTAGGGLEKMIGGKVGIRAEVRTRSTGKKTGEPSRGKLSRFPYRLMEAKPIFPLGLFYTSESVLALPEILGIIPEDILL